jgi:hypothetical protein
VERDRAPPERPDLLRVDVDAGDTIPEIGEAGTRDQAHVSCADDTDGCHGASPHNAYKIIASCAKMRPKDIHDPSDASLRVSLTRTVAQG